jgi:hypothetical protein
MEVAETASNKRPELKKEMAVDRVENTKGALRRFRQTKVTTP